MKLKTELKTLLAARAITASELSKKSGVSKQTISDWMAGREPKRLTQVKKVADVLNVSLDELCFGSNTETLERKQNIEQLLTEQWVSGVFEVKFRRLKK